jgi:hypothetical protein
MTLPIASIENGQILWVQVNTNRHANERLWLFSGVAVLESWHRTDQDRWGSEDVSISMRTIRGAPAIRPNQWVDAVAMAAPASVQFRESASRDRIGFSVDSFAAWQPVGDFPEDYGLNVRISLRGNDAWFYRISFQLNVLTRDVG